MFNVGWSPQSKHESKIENEKENLQHDLNRLRKKYSIDFIKESNTHIKDKSKPTCTSDWPRNNVSKFYCIDPTAWETEVWLLQSWCNHITKNRTWDNLTNTDLLCYDLDNPSIFHRIVTANEAYLKYGAPKFLVDNYNVYQSYVLHYIAYNGWDAYKERYIALGKYYHDFK